MKFFAKDFSERILKSIEIFSVVLIVLFFLLLNQLFASKPWSSLMVPLAFLYVPFFVILWRKLDRNRFGLGFPKVDRKKCMDLFRVLVFSFIPFIIGFHIWQIKIQGFQLHTTSFPSLMAILSHLFFQFLVVALPEEFFFRTYLQTRLSDIKIFSREKNKYLVNIFPGGLSAILISNGLFALTHLIGDVNPVRLLTFFPGLLFAYLWEKTGQLWIVVLFHALCNTLLFVLNSIYFS